MHGETTASTSSPIPPHQPQQRRPEQFPRHIRHVTSIPNQHHIRRPVIVVSRRRKRPRHRLRDDAACVRWLGRHRRVPTAIRAARLPCRTAAGRPRPVGPVADIGIVAAECGELGVPVASRVVGGVACLGADEGDEEGEPGEEEEGVDCDGGGHGGCGLGSGG